MNEKYEKLRENLISIACELFRFQRVFMKAISKLEVDEHSKYNSQYSWFSKKVLKALDDSGLRIISLNGQLYDPGMAVAPLNLEDFEIGDILCIEQTMEPIIMEGDVVIKAGTVLLRRKDK